MNRENFRQKFHIEPKKGLINDPNGLIFYKGEYHFFYQHSPEECNHLNKQWSHIKSKDLISWEELPPALKPTDYFDKNGCYSGSAIEKDGKLYLLYTGNVKENGVRTPYQVLAESEDGINFKKTAILLKTFEKGYTAHFRDPKVYKENGEYHFILGAQRENLTGTALKYSSKNLLDWEFKGELIHGEDFGYMVECPDLITLEDKQILLCSPQGIEPQGEKYKNRYQSGYILGGKTLEESNFLFKDFIELDRGFEFYAPQTFKDEKGRTILVGWMGMPEEEEHPTVEDGWIHCLTLPRELKLIEDKLYQIPLVEFEKLRKSEIMYKELRVEKEFSTPIILGTTYEMKIDFEKVEEDFSIYLRASKDEREKTIFSYNYSENSLTLDRKSSGEGYKGERKVYLDKQLESIHIFMDSSSVEIFVNGGREVFTARIYPKVESENIKIVCEKEIVIKKLEFYSI